MKVVHDSVLGGRAVKCVSCIGVVTCAHVHERESGVRRHTSEEGTAVASGTRH